jgi:small-conductance mechanosensitive channel
MTDRVPSTLTEQAEELELSFLNRRGHYDVLRKLPEGKGRPKQEELNRLRDRLLILRDAAHTMKALAEKDAADA